MKTFVFTGGHHTSALPVALALKKEGWKIIWFGHKHSLWNDRNDSGEYRDVTAAGMEFHDIHTGKFYRTFNPLKLVRIVFGLLQTLGLLLLIRPTGIISFGGYIAVPTVISGWCLGIRSLAHEQTITTGWANRVVARFVSRIAVTWPESLKFYPKDKVVLMGLPLRPEILNIKRELNPKRSTLKTIYVTGGKNGSRILNRTVSLILPKLLEKYRVIFQTGFKDYDEIKKISSPNLEVFAYDSSRAISALSVANVVIGRAGAHIVYELGILGIPSVLVPISWSSHGEQAKNAQFLASHGLSVVVPESHLDAEYLLNAIQSALLLKPIKLDLPTDGLSKLVQLIKQEFK